MPNYIAKADVFKAPTVKDFVKVVGDARAKGRVAVVTAIVMQAYCEGLEGMRLGPKVVAAQKIQRAHGILPSALKDPVKRAYMEAITLQ